MPHLKAGRRVGSSGSKGRLFQEPRTISRASSSLLCCRFKGKHALSGVSSVSRKAISDRIFSYTHCSELGSKDGKYFINVPLISLQI